MKRIITVLLLMILLLGVCPVYAENEPAISVTMGNMDEYNMIEAVVSISNNPGIAGFTLRLHFDNTKLLPVLITNGEAITTEDISSNIQQGDDLSDLDFVTALWSNATNITADGTLYTVKFKVKEAGFTQLTLSYTPGDIANQNLQPVNVDTVNGIADLPTPQDFVITVTNNGLINTGSVISGNLGFKITNNTESSGKADVILAIYDSEKLVFLNVEKNFSLPKGDAPLGFTGLNVTVSGNCEVKIMCWDSISTMRPMTLPKTFNL